MDVCGRQGLGQQFGGLVGMKPYICQLPYRNLVLDTRSLSAAANQKKNDVVDDVASWSELGALLMQAYRFDDRVKVMNTAEVADIADDNIVGPEVPASAKLVSFLNGTGLISSPSDQFGMTLMRRGAIPSRSSVFSISSPRTTFVVAERSDLLRRSRSKLKSGRAGGSSDPQSLSHLRKEILKPVDELGPSQFRDDAGQDREQRRVGLGDDDISAAR